MVATATTTPAKKVDKFAARKVRTPEFRVSFPQVFKPKAFESQEPKYSIVMLFAKTADLKAMKQAVLAAAIEKFGPKEKWPKNLRMPFKDGNDKADMDGYKDMIVVNASAKADKRPGVVNQQLEDMTEADGQFYAGCYARATLMAYGYDTAGNRGVSFGLQDIQKLRDGVPFSGRKKAQDEFEAVDDVADDADLSVGGDGDDDGLGLD